MQMAELMELCCAKCGGAGLAPAQARSAFWQDERLVVVEGIPVLQCDRCGEQFYDDMTVVGLDRLRGGGFPPELAVRVVEVTVYEFPDQPIAKTAT
jgi:YgiT-type zinc finger domain-containing protein